MRNWIGFRNQNSKVRMTDQCDHGNSEQTLLITIKVARIHFPQNHIKYNRRCLHAEVNAFEGQFKKYKVRKIPDHISRANYSVRGILFYIFFIILENERTILFRLFNFRIEIIDY